MSNAPGDRVAVDALWALEATTDNVILVDREFRVTFINQATADLNDITQESVLGRSLWEVWPGNVGTAIETNYRRAMTEGGPIRFVHGYFEAGRFDLWLEIHACPSPDGLAIFFHDVTDARRQAAREAADGERLARAISATDLGVWRVNLPFDGTPFFLSPQLRRQLGVSDDEDIAMEQFVALLHPDDVQLASNAIARAISDRVPYDVVYRTVGRDGKTRWVRASGNAFYREDGTPYQFDGYSLDYTERIETERALRAAKARIDATLASADVGTWVLDVPNDRINGDANLGRLFGMTESEAEVGSAADYLARLHPEDRERVATVLGRSLLDGSDYEAEYRVLVDGRVRWLVARGNAERDEAGHVVRLPGVVVDITVLKEAQAREQAAMEAMRELNASLDDIVRRRTEDLTRANRDLDAFAYSVAHDLRAPLRAIVSTSRILLEEAGERLSEEERAALDRQATNAVRLAGIVDDLLGFARLANSPMKTAPFDMTALARSTAEEVTGRWKQHVEVAVAEGMSAEGDERLLRHALTNLLDNACKFSPDGGRIAVGEEGGAFFVRDEGVGFDMQHAPKLFVAFERLVSQESFEGTGVGLANVRRIVERHGGRVWAESEPGEGATFWFTLG